MTVTSEHIFKSKRDKDIFLRQKGLHYKRSPTLGLEYWDNTVSMSDALTIQAVVKQLTYNRIEVTIVEFELT